MSEQVYAFSGTTSTGRVFEYTTDDLGRARDVFKTWRGHVACGFMIMFTVEPALPEETDES